MDAQDGRVLASSLANVRQVLRQGAMNAVTLLFGGRAARRFNPEHVNPLPRSEVSRRSRSCIPHDVNE
jgi:hypothetical protein